MFQNWQLGARLRRYFFAGVVVTAPLALTLYLAWLLVHGMDIWVSDLLPDTYEPILMWLPGAGLLLVLLALTFVGSLTASFVGRWWLHLTENVLHRLPVLRGVYGAIKQLLQALLTDTNKAFQEVVLVPYPHQGMWAIGFVTNKNTQSITTRDDMVAIYIPTTPSPTAGYLVFVPYADVRKLDISVESAMKAIVSGGLVLPR